MKAPIVKILPVSFIDGPGSRTVIFFQGCNLKCLYCHNPETQQLCNNCGVCVSNCNSNALTISASSKTIHNPNNCTNCDSCIKLCPSFSNPKYTFYSTAWLHDFVGKSQDFIDGITFSGGECTLYTDFILEFISKINKTTKLTTLIDTNGHICETDFINLSKKVDGFIIDLKSFDKNIHIKLTGLGNNLILRNIVRASNLSLLYEVRTVLVEGFNDSIDEVMSISNFMKNNAPNTNLKLIPYRPHGVKSHLKNCPPFSIQKYESLFEVGRGILGDKCVRPMEFTQTFS